MTLPRKVVGIGLSILWGFGCVHLGLAQDNAARRRVLIGFSRSMDPDAQVEVVHGAGGEVNHAYHLLPVVSATLTDDVIEWFAERPDVAYVEDDVRVYATDEMLPWGVDRIDADVVWGTSQGNAGAGVDVAILDTGIDSDHPDLRVVGGVNYTGQFVMHGSTRRSGWDDQEGHGTHCAGVIGVMKNGIGVVGVAPEANLWAVKVLSDDRSGYVSDVIKGLEWCVDNGIEIVSMSFAGTYSTTLEQACDLAYAADVLLVAASGNDGGPVGYPAAHPSVIAVSAVDAAGDLLACSNTGVEIELTAPGADIRSTYPDGAYTRLSGTSMACPHVAGAAALVWACSDLGLHGAAAVRARLCETAERLDHRAASEIGYGLVDAGKAATAPPVIDLAITGVTAVDTAVEGDVVDVAIAVRNEGNRDVSGEVHVTLSCDDGTPGPQGDGPIIGVETIGGLAAGTSATLTCAWDTTGWASGSYTLTGRHDLFDDDPANNVASALVAVRAAVTDIAVTAISAPETIVQGQPVEIGVTMENLGDFPVSPDIQVVLTSDNGTAADSADDLSIGSQSIGGGLAVGQSQVMTLIWDTGDARIAEHTLTARHTLLDDHAENDRRSVTVTVSEVALSEVSISYATPRSLWAGMQGSLMIRGRGFLDGATVAFENGQGPVPSVTDVRVLGESSLVGRVVVPDEVLPQPVPWDVRVTNPDGSSDVLPGAFTVQP